MVCAPQAVALAGGGPAAGPIRRPSRGIFLPPSFILPENECVNEGLTTGVSHVYYRKQEKYIMKKTQEIVDDQGQKWLETLDSFTDSLTGAAHTRVIRRVLLIDEEYRGFTIGNDVKTDIRNDIHGKELRVDTVMKQLCITELERPREYSTDGKSYILNDVSGTYGSLKSAKDRIDFILAHPFWCPMSNRDTAYCKKNDPEYKKIFG